MSIHTIYLEKSTHSGNMSKFQFVFQFCFQCIVSCTSVSVFFWPLWGRWLRSRMRTEPSLPPLHPQLATDK